MKTVRDDVNTSSYVSIKEDILRRIHNNVLPPGALLAGEMELAAEFGVARGTVNRALRELTELGFLERKRKGGTRVRLSPLRAARFAIPLVRTEIEGLGAHYQYQLLLQAEAIGPADVRETLALPPKAKLLHLQCLHRADGASYQFEERWINLSALPQARTVDFTESGPNEWLVKTVPYSDVEIRISAVAATPSVAQQLNTTAGQAVMCVRRTTWFQGNSLTHVRLYHHQNYELVTRY